MPTALITGASRGLGRALAGALADRGWTLVLDARGAGDLALVADELSRRTSVHAIPGDVASPAHRTALAGAVSALGDLDLLVNNASTLGPSPLPALADLETPDLLDVLLTNTVAPLALFRAVRPHLAPGAVVVDVSSDAAVEAYPGWGAYGASKAALDHLSAVLAEEHPDLHVYAVDPGDMRTAMHQAAFPGEDISDRPLPDAVVPGFLRLVEERPPSGRLRAADLLPEVAA
jgi:NAD(P)-dependent dehydrogenase (short-subunit alcohol dehydrogenase family)